jgi:class 3 adenylate cyclase/CHASE2 domain-containing sensor protein
VVRGGKTNQLFNAVAVSLVFVVVLGISLTPVGTSELANTATGPIAIFEHLDPLVHDRLTRMRNRSGAQPVSPEVVLIGIDDPTIQELGLYGRGAWLTRKPFEDHLRSCLSVYKPRILAYDLLFKPYEAEAGIDAESDPFDLSYDSERLTAIEKSIHSFANGESEALSADVLLDSAELVTEQGDVRVMHAMSGNTGDTSLLLAYNFNDLRNSVFSPAAIIGTDETDYHEENGAVLPFLRDMSIPQEHMSGIPEDYPFYNNGSTPTNAFLDYAQLGYINVWRDEDGTVRRNPLVVGLRYDWTWPEGHEEAGTREDREIWVPSLAFLSCLNFWGIDLAGLHMDEAWEVDGKPVVEVKLGESIIVRPPGKPERHIPIDKWGCFLIDYVGDVSDFETVSFRYTTEARWQGAKDILENRLAFVGATFTGGTDAGPMTIHEYRPWVLVHMATASNLLNETYLQPIYGAGQTWILSGLALLLAISSTFLRPKGYGAVTLILAVAYGAMIWLQLASHQYLLPVSAPVTLMVTSFLVVVLRHYISEERQKRRIRGMFSTMVSPEVLDYMETNPDSFSLGGHEAEATMFFSDVAGFTTISESLSSAALVELLNKYLSPMSDIILSSGGYIDKYEGDAIMAEWGVPAPDPDHAKHACWSALEQQAKLAELRPQLLEEFGHDITVRMGINSGRVSAGNMGSSQKFQYTVMGDAVNQAARYEPTNKIYGTLIMIGNSTYELAAPYIEARLLDRIVVKGKTVPIKVFELLAKKGEMSEEKARIVERYQRGLALHIERRWEEAISCFQEALAIDPEDGPSQTLLTRVRGYQSDPPPDSWQGEYIRTSKD